MRQLAFIALWISGAGVLAADKDDAHYLVVHQEADSRFISTIERVGDCKIRGAPLPASRIRMLLIFDGEWCVRKAFVVQSSGYWRLDEVLLNLAMTMKFKPSVIEQYVDG
jgi:hypothetical protein